MLSIKPIGGTETEVNYYANLGEAENLDYYSEDGTSSGVYFGLGATELGLRGEVNASELRNLLAGFSPGGAQQLVSARSGAKVSRRAGFDLTFSWAKSVSIAWAVASPELREQIDECAWKALRRTLELIQEVCGVARRGKDGAITESAKLTFAVFSHDTARGLPGQTPDVNRHFHAVLPNVVVREDGTTGALDARSLFTRRMKMALGASFRAEFAKGLDALGLTTQRPKNNRDEPKSWFELSCVPAPLIESMSKRRKEIETWLREQGLSGAKAAEKAALQTRYAKQKHSQCELLQSWRSTAGKYGFTSQSVKQSIGFSSWAPVESWRASKEVVRLALDSLTSTKARFSEIELLESTAVEAQCRGVGIDEILASVRSTIDNSQELVELQTDGFVRTFTTQEMLRLEKRMLGNASLLKSRSSHTVSLVDIQKAISQSPTLREEQREAVRYLCGGGDIACLQGVAGAGKTFALKVAREAFETAGYRVIGSALAAKAACGLQDGAGIESTHLHSLLALIRDDAIRFDSNTILVVDEAGMIGTRQMQELLSLVSERKAKVVLVGATDQLQPIDAGRAYGGIVEAVGDISMNEIIRQREAWARRMVQDLRVGNSFRALQELEERGQLFIGQDRDEAIEQLVVDWKQHIARLSNLENTMCLAGTNIEVHRVNLRLQRERLLAGQLGTKSIEVDETRFFVGDRVMTTRNNTKLYVQNGSLGVLTDIEGTNISIRLDSGFQIEIDTSEYMHLSLGYCFTTHKSQGTTVSDTFILTGDSMTDREMSYVEGSRARRATRLYSDVLSAEGIPELAELMARSRQKELAYEHLIEAC